MLPNLAMAAETDLELRVAGMSMQIVLGVSALVVAILLLTALTKSRSNILFATIVVSVLGTTAFLIGSTIYLNQISSSKGPVHWHADTEVWACGQELDYLNPTGRLSNKVGTPTLHEHNDKWIHLEGVVINRSDASLGKFFQVIGGEITASSMTVQTDRGPQKFINGQGCAGVKGEVQVFVYKVNADKNYTVTKVDNPGDYIISAQSQVPPADCIIIEFDRRKEMTDKMCRSYEVGLEVGKIKGKVPQ